MLQLKEIDKYKILGAIGSGHFGQVFRALDRALNAEKAIKVLNSTNPRELLKSLIEAQILSKCRHKHIVTINEANIFPVQGQRRVVLDLEYISAGSLESALNAGWVPLEDSIRHLRGALLGLEHAHSEAILHRDIKPANILLATSGSKLSDFGLATAPGATGKSGAAGYLTHMAPECFSLDATSVLSDVYAAGLTLFRAVSNIADWQTRIASLRNLGKVMQKGTLVEEIGFAPFIPSRIKRIIRKACAPDPDKRYQSAFAFRQQLDRLRFSIRWVLAGPSEWTGKERGGAAFQATVDASQRHVIMKKDGRRVLEHCRSFASPQDAVAGLSECVATTTLSDA